MSLPVNLQRYPLAFLPTPLHPLPRLSASFDAPVSQLLDQTRRPDRACRRRQQDAQAGAAARRCPGPGLRHADHHRRGAVQPLPPDAAAAAAPGWRATWSSADSRPSCPTATASWTSARCDAALDDA